MELICSQLVARAGLHFISGEMNYIAFGSSDAGSLASCSASFSFLDLSMQIHNTYKYDVTNDKSGGSTFSYKQKLSSQRLILGVKYTTKVVTEIMICS